MHNVENCNFVISEQNGYVMYGIRIKADNGAEFVYPQISAEKQKARILLQRIEGSDISPVHYDDIVRDFIIENACHLIEANGIYL